MRVLLVLAAIVAIALAQNPSPPQWANAFSASMVVEASDQPYPFFLRWFYDYGNAKSRLDGPAAWNNEIYFATMIFDHSAQTGWGLFFKDDVEVCITFPIASKPFKPDFSTFTYAGIAMIEGFPVYHWLAQNKTAGAYFQYFDATSTERQPVRFDAVDANWKEETWTFFEYDEGTQDSSLFVVPDSWKANCNKMPTPPPKVAKLAN